MGISSLPDDFDKLVSLEYLDLYSGRFESFPEPLTRMPNLRHLFLEQCYIVSVPDAVGNMSGLKSFSMDSNMLTGNISASLSKLPLSYLVLSSTDEVVMPEREVGGFLEGFSSVRIAYFYRTGLCGELPENLPELMPELVSLNLDENKITGNIPASYAGFPHLVELYLRDNRMEGTVPQETVDSPYFERWRIDRQQEGYGLIIPQPEGAIPQRLSMTLNLLGRALPERTASGKTISAVLRWKAVVRNFYKNCRNPLKNKILIVYLQPAKRLCGV